MSIKELEILEKYLSGVLPYRRAIDQIESIIKTLNYSEKSKYSPLKRCVYSWEAGDLADFCGNLRQTLGYFNSSITVSEEIYSTILSYKNRFGFVMTDFTGFEINIKTEMLSDIDDLKSTYRFERRNNKPVSISNGVIYRYFNYGSFTSLHQKLMMYFVCNMKKNQTLLACLPTGAGKSLTWQFMSISEMYSGCTIVVVPTVALAINHESSAKDLFERIPGFTKTVRAYYSSLSTERKQIIFQELENNSLSLLFISPEALLTKSFKSKIIEASEEGKVSALIVDEVHLVVSWGMKFRPEFQLLPSLRNELQRKSPSGIKTILLSATITEYDKLTISRLFGKEGLIEYRADELRPEFEYYAHECATNEEREELIKKLVDQVPRPLIVYTVTPAFANHYYNLLKEYGYDRIEVFTGETSDSSRKEIINRWNRDDLDIIVATSAFGMGVDKPDIRTILTTYIPESVSRYYQEVGRAGRDGYSALNYWLYCFEEDNNIIKNLTDTALLTEKRLSERWDALYRKASRISANRIRIEMSSIPEDMKGNLIGKQHANWNKDAVLLLYREGIIDIVDMKILSPLNYEIEVVLNNIPILENKDLLEEYIADFRNEERQSINDNKESVYMMLKYYNKECFSTFFTQEFPYASDVCSGCPYCRSQKIVAPVFPETVDGTDLQTTKNDSRVKFYNNIYMNNIGERGVSLITYTDKLEEYQCNQLTEMMIRHGVECLVKEEWNNSVLGKLSNLDQANYMLLTYYEFDQIDALWIGGPIIFFLTEDDNRNNEIYDDVMNLVDENTPIVFVGKASIRINSEEKTLKELSDYNTLLDNLIRGEYL